MQVLTLKVRLISERFFGGPGADFFRWPNMFIAHQICSSVTRPLIKINPVEGAEFWAAAPSALLFRQFNAL